MGIFSIEADLFDVAAKGQVVLVKFENDPDVMALLAAINKVMADFGQAPIALKK